MKNILNKLNKFKKDLKSKKPLTAEQAKEKIISLRKSMKYFATESISISILALLLFIGAPAVFPEIINPYLPSALKIMQAIIIVPTAFWIFVFVSNIVRFITIAKLQKSLSSKK